MVTATAPGFEHQVKTRLPDEYHDPDSAPLATFLGLFSIGLGLAEVLYPHKVAARTGVPYPNLIRAFGVREIAAGVGLLSSKDPEPWLWGRVAGDVLDLATLAASYAQVGESGKRRAVQAAAAVAGVTLLDVLAACEHTGASDSEL